MKIIGLTGSIATGKSTVSAYLQSLGEVVIDCDLIARDCVAPHSEGLRQIVATFGSDILLSDGALDRHALGHVIFDNHEKRAQLDAILHPLILEEVDRQVSFWRKKGVDRLFIDMPLLYEIGYEANVDEVWLVYVPQSVQLERLILRNNITKEEAEQRVYSQLSIEDKKRRANVIVDNSFSKENTYRQVDLLLKEKGGN